MISISSLCVVLQVTEISMGEFIIHSSALWQNARPSLGRMRKDPELTLFRKSDLIYCDFKTLQFMLCSMFNIKALSQCFYSSSLQGSTHFGVSGKQVKEKNGELWSYQIINLIINVHQYLQKEVPQFKNITCTDITLLHWSIN